MSCVCKEAVVNHSNADVMADHGIPHFRCEGLGSSEQTSVVTTKQILLRGSVPRIDFPSSLCVGQSDIPFFSAARNFAVFFKILYLFNQLALRHR